MIIRNKYIHNYKMSTAFNEINLKDYINNKIDERINEYLVKCGIVYDKTKNIDDYYLKLKTNIDNEYNEIKQIENISKKSTDENTIKYEPNTNINEKPFKETLNDFYNGNNLKDVKLGPNENVAFNFSKYQEEVSDAMKNLLKQKYNHYYGDITSYTFEDNQLFNTFMNNLNRNTLIELFKNIKINLDEFDDKGIKMHIEWISSIEDIPSCVRNEYYQIVKMIIREKYRKVLNLKNPSFDKEDKTYFEQMLVSELHQNFDLIIDTIIKKYDKQIFDYLFGQKYYMVDDGRK